MSGSAWDCDRGYVAFLNTTYPLSPSVPVATWGMSPSQHRGLKARAPEPLPSLSRLSFPPLFLSPSRSFRRFWGASPVLRRPC
ncbi:hypothetical protein Taro_030159 [Colocasia esculenta]|uniref:Uncharacterized protein n=1 Tax=Colocasia esculenta TaxID=4460 RepID=A0A843VTB1_COLES|nr:hypothetical protein [Colocasia esculenta]